MRYDVHPAYLKLEVATRGIVLDPSVRAHTALLRPTTGADAVARSLDLVLPDDVWVSAPVEERATAGSPFRLLADGERFFLARRNPDGAESLRIEIRAIPQPRFYERHTTRGTPMWRVAAVHGSHLCRFCVEGARATSERDAAAPVEDVLEVIRAAFDEGAAEFVYFNSGFFDAEDGGIGFLAPYIDAVRRHFDTLIATQVHPPRDNHWIDRTYAMGVDALSYNLEIFDEDVLKRHCVGRARYIGRERYLEALGYAAQVFPSGTVWTDLVVGLESTASTMRGIDALTAMAVVPVVSVFRTPEAAGPRAALDTPEVTPVLAHLYRAVKERRINMGWMRDLALGITPLEARHFAGADARLAVAVQQLTRSRLGALAARSLARFRRRLRVRTVSESFDSSHL
ncbi:MAG: radical SAM protein [Deltaproteobacteria bacterium]|nr:MAG: radical SAM protein [Deltaproteobacteria bacterium]